MEIDLTFQLLCGVMGFVASDVAEFSGKYKGDLTPYLQEFGARY